MLIDLLVLQPSYVRFQPSSIAFAALFLASFTIGECAIAPVIANQRADSFHYPTLSRRLQPSRTSSNSSVSISPSETTAATINSVPTADSIVSPTSFSIEYLSAWLYQFQNIVEINPSDCIRCIKDMYPLYHQFFSPSERVDNLLAVRVIHQKYSKPEYGYVACILPREFPIGCSFS
jgi:hypothetical protein